MERIYLRVTKDEYELPTAVARTISEMSRITGKSCETIASQVCRRRLYGVKSEFVGVDVEEESEEE